MANLHITELAGLGLAEDGSVLALPADFVTTQTVAISTVTSSNVFKSNTDMIYVVAGAACAIALGTAPVAAAGGCFLASGQAIFISVPPGAGYKISVVTDTL
jgi:hypothetical protein